MIQVHDGPLVFCLNTIYYFSWSKTILGMTKQTFNYIHTKQWKKFFYQKLKEESNRPEDESSTEKTKRAMPFYLRRFEVL